MASANGIARILVDTVAGPDGGGGAPAWEAQALALTGAEVAVNENAHFSLAELPFPQQEAAALLEASEPKPEPEPELHDVDATDLAADIAPGPVGDAPEAGNAPAAGEIPQA